MPIIIISSLKVFVVQTQHMISLNTQKYRPIFQDPVIYPVYHGIFMSRDSVIFTVVRAVVATSRDIEKPTKFFLLICTLRVCSNRNI